MRHYNAEALVRLQRILLLRELGLSLNDIAHLLDEQRDPAEALRGHLQQLRGDRRRLNQQIKSVRRTIVALENGAELMAQDILAGFNHDQYRKEVAQRWGHPAAQASDDWWQSLGVAAQTEWKERVATLNAAWTQAAAEGVSPASDRAQTLAAAHADWLASVPGTPGHEQGRPDSEYLLGLGEMYVADPRFAANYGGQPGAELVRNALQVYVAHRG